MAEKKRILIVSYYFAPQNVIGAVRPTKLAKYLARMGHEVTVICGLGRDGKKDPTPALGNADAGGDILTEKQFFNCHGVRLGNLQKLLHIPVNNGQSGRKCHPCRGGDGAAAQKGRCAAIGFDHAEAGDAVTRVDSQYPHYLPPRNRLE